MKTSRKIVKLAFCALIITSCGQSDKTKPTVNKIGDEKEKIREELKKIPAQKKLDPATFEILIENHYPAAENFHVLLKTQTLTKDSLQIFVNMFRQEYCTKQCNIDLYDDKSIRSLLTKYPLSDKEYLNVADHYVATSSFEIPEIALYPYQDIKYKELGGRNWKRKPIK